MRPFERKSLARVWPFGLDSVQGYLELPEWYPRGDVIFSCDPADHRRFGSMYFQLVQLEEDGLVNIEWEPQKSDDGRDLMILKQISLTTSGYKLLGELRAKSRFGKLKERLVTLIWAVGASVVTTLVMFVLKGG